MDVKNSEYQSDELARTNQLLQEEIAELKKTQKSLRISEEKFRNVFNNSPVGKVILNLNGELQTNQTCQQILGYSEQELSKIDWQDITHPDDLLRDQKIRASIISGERSSSQWEKRFIHKDGHTVWVEISSVLQRDTEGNPLYFITTIQDIAERKQAEIALRDEKDRIRTILDLVGDPIFVKDNDHCITIANRAFYELFGLDEKSVIGSTLVEAVPENEQHHFLKVDRSVLDTGIPDLQEEELTVGDTKRFIITRKTRFIDESGKRFLVGSIHDITERKLAEETLRETNEYLQNLINHANAPIIVWDNEFKITRFNRAFENLSGYDADEVIGKKVDVLFPKNRIESSLELINRTAFGARWESVEIEILRKHGEIRIVLWNSANIFDNKQSEIIATIAQGQDITERKRAEEKVIQVNDRLRRFIDSNIIGVVIATADGKIVETNDYYLNTIGFSREEFEAGIIDWIAITPPEWLPADEKAILEMHEHGTCIPYEKEYQRRDGTRVAVLLADAMLPGPEEQIVAFALDVTDRKKAEYALRESEEKFRKLLESTPLPICYVNKDGMITFRNERFISVFGYSAIEIPSLAEWWQKAYPDPEYRKWVLQNWESAVSRASLTATDIESEVYHVTCKNGDVREIIISGTTINDNFLATFIDITDRIKAEEEIRIHSGRLQNLHMIDQAILEAIESPEAVVQTALHYMRDLLQCQRTSVGIFDLEKKEVQVYAADVDGKTIVQIGTILTEEVYGVIDIIRQHKMEIIENMSTVSSPSAINLILQAEGIQSSINVALVSELEMYGVLNVGWEKPRAITKEETEIVVEVANQITIAIEKARLLKETKRYAAEMEQRVIERTFQLEVANNELEAFSYSVSHDLRAPLRHISGFADMLSRDAQKQLPEKSQHYLDVINNSTQKMGILIDDLLSFSRTGRAEMKKSSFSMNQLLDDALLQVKNSAANRKISWNIANLPEVFGDFNLVRLVWVNLLDNAVKYTGPRKLAEIYIDFTEDKEEYIFSIRDNGVGFDMKYANKLFGVFQRLHPIEEFEGTGIGLANVRRIISRHGGRTWAEAKLDQGATFYFSLPRERL
jgi:PAS domain S-box-containing protein